MLFKLVWFWCILIASCAYLCDSEKSKLRGVTIGNSPFISEKNGKFTGLLVDMMDIMAEMNNFEYQLYLSPDGAYGQPDKNGTVNGMIGQVNRTKADFALADLTILEHRKQFVDFTMPYRVDPLTILIHKDYAKNMSTFEDLVNYNEKMKGKSDEISVGLVIETLTYKKMSSTNDSIGKRLFELSNQNLVLTVAQGLFRVKNSQFGLIIPHDYAKFYTKLDCKLTTLKDNRDLFKHRYAIALQKGSYLVEEFNRAIQELTNDGSFNILRDNYLTDNCT